VARRSYGQFCGVAHALDLVGERWTLLLVRNLLLGPRRYGELLAETPGLTTNLLAERLQQLTSAGLLVHEGDRYRLTELGRALDPVVVELGRFGQRYLTRPGKKERLDLMWAFLSMRRRYRGGPLRAVRVDARNRVRGHDRVRTFTFFANDKGGLEVRDTGDLPALLHVHARAAGDAASFLGWLRGTASPAALEATGAWTLDGDPAAWRAFTDAVAPMPQLTSSAPSPTSKT
jgi:DNA-binding HxlR family transcriptional regulator